jgi:hypothetical protein
MTIERPFINCFQLQSERIIPPRFSVIAGEIVHHLRSCLDHIAWSLSGQQYRIDHETAIAFPLVTKIKPWTKKEAESYERKVKGITSADALALIERLQPYHAGEPADDPLAVIHHLDRIDKHHNLVLVVIGINVTVNIPFPQTSLIFGGMERQENSPTRGPQDNPEIRVAFTVAFSEFGKRKNQSIIPSLTNLADSIGNVIKLFAGEI